MQYILNFKGDAKVDYVVIHESQELDEDTEFWKVGNMLM